MKLARLQPLVSSLAFRLLRAVGRRQADGTRPAAPAPIVAQAADDAAPDGERPLGCGWFDSSHELQTGLVVREHAANDPVLAELPLAHWLELQLSGYGASARAA
jgi:hypothetical protein